MSDTIRFLIHPVQDAEKFARVLNILDTAVKVDPGNWTRVVDEPSTVDHYGYYTSTRASVILSQEHNSAFYRLTIRPNENEVFHNLLGVMIEDF
jgi:hypothetical protein